MFPNCSHVLTKQVAIICLNPALTVEHTMVSMDERVVVASIMDQHHHTVCRIINSYVPAQRYARQDFLSSYLHMPFIEEVDAGPWLMVGDFNMNLHRHDTTQLQYVKPWFDWLIAHFDNCFPQGLPTFQRSHSCTTIDYIYGHYSLMSRLTNASSHFLPGEWTDHCLLTVDFLQERQDIGRGTWRFNHTLLTNDAFVTLLDNVTDLFFQEIEGDSASLDQSPQDIWESFKRMLKYTAQSFSKGSTGRHKRELATLQSKRQEILRDRIHHPPTQLDSDTQHQLQQVEQQIDTLIQRETQHAMLRSATRWHETGERNTKYFYRVIKERQQQQTIQSLKCSSTGTTLRDPKELIATTRCFYENLYTPDDIDTQAVDSILANIPASVKIPTADAEDMIAPVHKVDLLDLLARTPTDRSPGLDGIPFEVYRHLAPRSSQFCALLLKVVQQAFNGIFPTSWSETRMVLLYKKGDPELLTNWRPLSLINTDAKLFTKVVANRVNTVLPRLINPYQTGFMPHRLISDNGWINQAIMSNARATSSSHSQVAVLLDQEKAYDRVHPEYLKRVLERFGFPSSLIFSLVSLFFGTRIHVSINGWLGAPFTQGRGLRQGDPLSPLLFNLAFEPLLRSILASPLQGVSLKQINVASRLQAHPTLVSFKDRDGNDRLDPISLSVSDPPPNIKLLSYADDLEVFLDHPGEWSILKDILTLYGKASNAKVNLNKTVMMSLSGIPHDDWIEIATLYGSQWHDSTHPTALRYLGYPLWHNNTQLQHYLTEVKGKVARHASILKARNLSLRGAGMVANSLLLSKLWHVLRVVPVPTGWLDEVKQIIRSFLLPFWPTPSWDTLCLPRRFGGVGLVNLHHQSKALHFVYVQRLCKPGRPSDFISKWIIRYFQLLTGHASILPWFLFPSCFRPCVKNDPNMAHLTDLLQELPRLPISPDWSKRWLLDLPLQAALSASAPYPKFPLRYLISDIVEWLPRKHCFLLHQHRLPPLLTELVNTIRSTGSIETHRSLSLLDNLTIEIPSSRLCTPLVVSDPFIPKYPLPSLSHWNVAVSSVKHSQIPDLSLSQLRRL
ncbi:hypothetical protein RO3G_01611 [Lichtheimia corymbifera JMRC:FSU:9682]|uniref:Reverse transcriptase domain-containing protein n=1 Tax=Lichtheimia corymbifera JMRC:FSU:9682 TaxID=1263082 RepID=A0A068SFN0_9FUNG|nr:hypothetical protein RO3G_01611 [Lichtheimia corymbifera JMRC:FSU:9682]